MPQCFVLFFLPSSFLSCAFFSLPPPYIHSVFMSAHNKERGSIHAGGGVAANSWQLFKYLLFLSPPFLYISTLVSVGAAANGEGGG